jgi:thiol-disulfide isomerase/thioredoxin
MHAPDPSFDGSISKGNQTVGCGRRDRPGGARTRPVAFVTLVALLTCACEASPPTGSDPVATNATTTALLPQRVIALPSFDFGAYERLLYQLRGTPVVANIWASWCVPCKKEAPTLAEAAKRYGDDVQFIGVDIKDQRGAAAAFLTQYHLTYPTVFDESGDIHNSLGFVGLPDTVFYGADGKIIESWSGPLTSEALQANIERIRSSDGTSKE